MPQRRRLQNGRRPIGPRIGPIASARLARRTNSATGRLLASCFRWHGAAFIIGAAPTRSSDQPAGPLMRHILFLFPTLVRLVALDARAATFTTEKTDHGVTVKID